jgi:hypothetical protein
MAPILYNLGYRRQFVIERQLTENTEITLKTAEERGNRGHNPDEGVE